MKINCCIWNSNSENQIFHNKTEHTQHAYMCWGDSLDQHHVYILHNRTIADWLYYSIVCILFECSKYHDNAYINTYIHEDHAYIHTYIYTYIYTYLQIKDIYNYYIHKYMHTYRHTDHQKTCIHTTYVFSYLHTHDTHRSIHTHHTSIHTYVCRTIHIAP